MNSNGSRYLPSSNRVMATLEQWLTRIADSELPVLFVGEAGSGKKALAEHLHQTSSRRRGAWVVVNAAEINTEGLRRAWERATMGSIYLDNVGQLSADCQLAIEKYTSAVAKPINGASAPRVMCGATQDVGSYVRAGRMREDLLLSLGQICVRVPSLRQRREDIPALMDFFLTKYAEEMGHEKPVLNDDLKQSLLEHAWLGNIPELELASKAIIALGHDVSAMAGLRLLLGSLTETPLPVSLKEAARAASRQAERQIILQTLSRTNGNRKRAAQELQISYKALLYKLKQIALDRPANT